MAWEAITLVAVRERKILLDWSSVFFDEIKWTPGRSLNLARQEIRRGANAGATFEKYSKKTVSREGLRSETEIAATTHKTHKKIAQAKTAKMCRYCFISIQDRGEIIPAVNIYTRVGILSPSPAISISFARSFKVFSGLGQVRSVPKYVKKKEISANLRSLGELTEAFDGP